MAKGVSLHLGVNKVDRKVYEGLSEDLKGCVHDAEDMLAIAKSQGFIASLLIDNHATRPAVVGFVEKAAQTLENGDFFLLTYSGHGGLVDDTNGDELNGQDETWCLYDQQLIDDELYGLLAGFREGVRVLVIADCCFSGNTESTALAPMGADVSAEIENILFRALPADVAANLLQSQGRFYEAIQSKFAEGRQVGLSASVLHLSACGELQLAEDGSDNGVFTQTLKEVWDNGKFEGNYHRFCEAILRKIPNDQSPILRPLSTDGALFAGRAEKPFK